MKQWLHDFLSHPWVDCKEAADGADGRAECGKRGTSWGPSRYRYRKSATAAPSVTDVPVALPSSIFDFVPGTSPSWSPKVCTLHGRTPYLYSICAPHTLIDVSHGAWIELAETENEIQSSYSIFPYEWPHSLLPEHLAPRA